MLCIFAFGVCIRHAVGVTLPAEMLPAELMVAQTPEQARLLLDTHYQKVLGELIGAALKGKAISASEIVRRIPELSVKQAHHRLTRLCAAGLASVAGEQKRGGRPIKLYWASAKAYRVPFELTKAEDMGALFDELHRPYFAAYLRHIVRRQMELSSEQAVLIKTSADGQLSVNYGPLSRDNRPMAGYGTIGEMRLKPDTHTELEQRLRDLKSWALAREAEEMDDPDAEACIVGLMFAVGRLE